MRRTSSQRAILGSRQPSLLGAALLAVLLATGCSSSTKPAADAATDAGDDSDANDSSSSGAGGGGAGGENAGSGGSSGGASGSGGSTAGGGGSGGMAGNTGSGGDAGTSSSEDDCTANDECDDGVDCTTDECLAGVCTHAIEASACGSGEACDPREGGCTETAVCAGDPDCEDDDPCTQNETCNTAAAMCEWDLLDGDEDMHAPEACGGDDANDSAPGGYPGATEVCDEADNDNDGAIDEDPEASESCPEAEGVEVLCEHGFCTPQCTEPMQDCDGDITNGCESEIDVSMDEFCGDCAPSCGRCESGICRESACIRNSNYLRNFDFYNESGFASIWEALDHCAEVCTGNNGQCVQNCIMEDSTRELSSGCLDCFANAIECRRSDPSCSSPCVDQFELCTGTPYESCE